MKRILIIGAGKIAEEYLKVIKVNKNIVTNCIFSRTYTKALSLSKKYKIKNTFINKNNRYFPSFFNTHFSMKGYI